MKSLRFATLLGVVFLLSACAVTVDSRDFDVQGAMGVSGDAVVNDRLGLRSYPGSTIVSQHQRNGSSETTFETRASLDTVFDHFDRQLTNQGWRRSEAEFRPNRVEAEYRRSDGELDLELIRQGDSGRYRLEIDFDD